MAMGTMGRGRLMSEINVTPLVDVMLVLLIIFMVTAPLLQEQVSVDLPKAKAGPSDQDRKSVTLTITKGDQLYLDDKLIAFEDLDPTLKKIFQARDDKVIYLYADSGVSYGTVVKAMAVMQPLGLRLGIITEPPPEAKKHLK
jgi:biopolymer transport protein TolR